MAHLSRVETLEPRQLFDAVALPDQLAFAFPLGQADPVGVASDAAGNVYVAGHFEGTVDFNPAKRKSFNLTATSVDGDPFVAKYSAAGQFLWATHIGVPSTNPGRRDLTAGAITVDAAGRVYLTGGFDKIVDFDPGAGVSNLKRKPIAGGDAYLLALDTDGHFRFARSVRTPGTRGPDDILAGAGSHLATDAAGHVYLAVHVRDQPDLAPDHSYMLLLKYSRKGNVMWSRGFAGQPEIGDTGPRTVTTAALAVDADGNAYLAGRTTGNYTLGLLGAHQAYLLKLTPSGDQAWIRGVTDGATFSALATDADGNPYVAGQYTGAVDLNPRSSRTFILTSRGASDAFVARYSADTGDLDWARSIGGGQDDGAATLTIAADGTVNVTGQFAGRAYFNPAFNRFKLTSETAHDTFIAAFTPAGTFCDAGQIALRVTNLASRPAGGLLAAGLFFTAGDVDPSAAVSVLKPVDDGQTNLFVLGLT